MMDSLPKTNECLKEEHLQYYVVKFVNASERALMRSMGCYVNFLFGICAYVNMNDNMNYNGDRKIMFCLNWKWTLIDVFFKDCDFILYGIAKNDGMPYYYFWTEEVSRDLKLKICDKIVSKFMELIFIWSQICLKNGIVNDIRNIVSKLLGG